jgi:hypothetical protein
MFTDPSHLRASDPGTIEGNVVFTYLDAFGEDLTELEALKAYYRRGGLGDMHVKRRLDDILQALLAPIRERRAALARDPGYVLDVLQQGTMNAQGQTQSTLDELRNALGLFRLSPRRRRRGIRQPRRRTAAVQGILGGIGGVGSPANQEAGGAGRCSRLSGSIICR